MRSEIIKRAANARNALELYKIVPRNKRADLERFARCFGITKQDIERLTKGKPAR